eukprot:scaffold1867_cov247-Pinguiococcus_pyrenoidosus.AAC.10
MAAGGPQRVHVIPRLISSGVARTVSDVVLQICVVLLVAVQVRVHPKVVVVVFVVVVIILIADARRLRQQLVVKVHVRVQRDAGQGAQHPLRPQRGVRRPGGNGAEGVLPANFAWRFLLTLRADVLVGGLCVLIAAASRVFQVDGVGRCQEVHGLRRKGLRRKRLQRTVQTERGDGPVVVRVQHAIGDLDAKRTRAVLQEGEAVDLRVVDASVRKPLLRSAAADAVRGVGVS